MSYIFNLDEHRAHIVAEVICLKCLHRYICVWPRDTPLKHLFCEKCGPGYIVLTGQELE